MVCPLLPSSACPRPQCARHATAFRSAILNSGFDFPARRITVNLAPADLPKMGGRYDLPIALGILAASHQVDISSLHNTACFGELALSGDCCRVDGLLPSLVTCRQAGQSVVVSATKTPRKQAC